MSEPLILHQRIKLPYRYTAGPIHRAVLRGFAEHEMLGGKCDGCGHVAAPAQPFCPECSMSVTEVVTLGELGTLLSWTTAGDDSQYGFALVRLDGADGAMCHRIVLDGQLFKGTRVRIEWAEEPLQEVTAIDSFVRV